MRLLCKANCKKMQRISRISLIWILFSTCTISTVESKVFRDAMVLGEQLNAPTPFPEIYNNDLIHPCVRFAPNGFAGHKWWMVATPYWGFNSRIENPILYYGVADNTSQENSTIPKNWTPVTIVEGTQVYGYNSDPNLFFDKEGLWVLWREYYTPSCKSDSITMGTYGRYTTDGVVFSDKKLFAKEHSTTEDNELSPTVIPVNGKIKLFGCHHQFSPLRIPVGLSLWDIKDNDMFNNQFIETQETHPVYRPGFDFWHFDLFNYKDTLFCVVTPERANEILLGYSVDGANFKFWDTPLLTSNYTGRNYFYKPTAMVINDEFYLINPCAEFFEYPQTNRLWMSHMNFNELINKLNSNAIVSNTSVSDDELEISSSSNSLIINNKGKEIRVRIYSINGAVVYDNTIQHGINMLSFDRGVYIVATDTSRQKVIL